MQITKIRLIFAPINQKKYFFMTYEQYLESEKERVAQSGFSISDDELNPRLFPYNKGIV